jgi:hypothetical protein
MRDQTRTETTMLEHVVHREAEISRKAAERFAQISAAAERKAAAQHERREHRAAGRVRSAIASVAR